MTQTLADIMDDFLSCQATIQADSTVVKYQQAVGALARGLGRPPTLADLTEPTIVRAIKSLQIANSTKNSYLSPILRLWKWCHRTVEGLSEPSLPKFPVNQTIPVALTEAQMERLVREIACYEKVLPSGVPGKVYFRALFGLMALNGGERIGAVTQIEKSWVDLEKGVIIVPSHARKTTDWIVYELRDDVLKAVERLYDASDSHLLFDSDLTYAALLSRWKTILKRAGLEPNRKYTFHGLRRTCYSHIIKAGGNAQEQFRHKRNQDAAYRDPRIAGNRNDCGLIPFGMA
jgi:integrase